MKRFLYTIVVLLLLVPASVLAQVEKQVVVEKEYIPTVGSAQKLSIVPDMTDTVMMRPDVDYTISPRSFETSLMTENFRPATISYWDYQRSRPLYARAAAGVPLASEADVYIATHNKDRGYAMAYLNHWGDYRSRYNIAGEKVSSNTSEMNNRIGGRAGLFLGPRILEIDITGDHRLRHRYPMGGDKIAFGRGVGKIRFGDDFTDLSRWNFNIEVGGTQFVNGVGEGFNESNLVGKISLGKQIAGRHLLRIDAGYDGAFGGKTLEGYKNNIFSAGARYGFESERFEIVLGADYYYDKVAESTNAPHHIFPYLKLGWKNSSQGFVPFVEVDGELSRNDYASLIYANPYLLSNDALAQSIAAQPNETSYNGRVGFGGNLGDGLFAYNLSAELSLADNHLYWYSVGADYFVADAYQHTLHLDGNVLLRPSGKFEAEVRAGVYVWENYDGFYSNRPNFNVGASLRFLSRRFKAAADVNYASAIKWMTLDGEVDGKPLFGYTQTNDTLTLGIEVEWRINDKWAVYAEGRNLTGSKVYEWLHYYRSTPEAMLGVKFSL